MAREVAVAVSTQQPRRRPAEAVTEATAAMAEPVVMEEPVAQTRKANSTKRLAPGSPSTK